MADRGDDEDDEGWEGMQTTGELHQRDDRGDRELAKRLDEEKRIDLSRPGDEEDDDD